MWTSLKREDPSRGVLVSLIFLMAYLSPSSTGDSKEGEMGESQVSLKEF